MNVAFRMLCLIAMITSAAAAATVMDLRTKDDAWFSSAEGKKTIDNIISHQRDEGGWKKAYDVNSPNADANKKSGGSWDASTIDNGATYTELRVLGEHNRANALAAALAAYSAGAATAAIADGLRTLGGLEHRLEVVAERSGVLWINDSKATNIDSTRVALRSIDRPEVLLLGGRHKGEPYTGLLDDAARVRTVVAFGEAAAQVEQDLGAHVSVERVEGAFEDVVAHAAAIARTGDAVLLSPACASFDMFRDYEHRGRRFKELVGALGAQS